MTPSILGILYSTTRSRRMAATGPRSNDPIAGGRNGRVVPTNRPESALPASLDADVVVQSYCCSRDEKVSAPGGHSRLRACQSVVWG